MSTIGGRHPSGRPAAESSQHLLEVPSGVGRAGPVGLVDHEQVGDLHQPGLVGLHRVAPARVDHHDGGVGLAGDLDLDLADPDRLDEHQVEADGVEHAGPPAGVATARPPRWPRVAIERMKTSSVEGVVAHADPVAEDGPTGERRRRVDGQHPDPLAGRPGRGR